MPPSLQPPSLQHRDVMANGIRIHVAEQGAGPLVLLCHRFPRAVLRRVLYSISGDAPAETRQLSLEPGKGWLANTQDPERLPEWLTGADLDHMAAEFARSGFRGGLNWYRNIDRNWELTAPWAGARILQPALFIAGRLDLITEFGSGPAALEALPAVVPGLRRRMLIDGAGHFVQQERPRLVNDALLEFFSGLRAWG